jgi:hypothetical protein
MAASDIVLLSLRNEPLHASFSNHLLHNGFCSFASDPPPPSTPARLRIATQPFPVSKARGGPRARASGSMLLLHPGHRHTLSM